MFLWALVPTSSMQVAARRHVQVLKAELQVWTATITFLWGQNIEALGLWTKCAPAIPQAPPAPL